MPHSLSQSANLNCPNCGRPFTADVWLIVDASERPDLLDRSRAGTLHDLPCPHCDHAGQVDAPLLLYRPGETPPLLFSPARRTTAEQDREQAEGLLGYLHHALGSAWQDEWRETMPTVPRDFLPAALSDDPETAMRQMAAQAEQALARLREEDPAAYRELEAAARQMAGENPLADQAAEQDQSPPELDPARAQALADDLVAWMQQETLAASEAYLDARQAAFLTDEGRYVMGLLAQANPGNPIVSDHQRRLARAREIGVPALYAEIRQQRVQEASAAEAAMPPVLREVLAELAQSGVTINSPEELERALAARPDLQAKLAAALGSGPAVPPQFQTDLQQAQTGEQRYVQRGDRRGLDEAAAAWERILQHPTFANAPDRFQLAAYNNGGGVFLRRYWAQGQLADLTRALELWQTAVQRTPPDSPDLPLSLNNLGNGLSDRYARTGALADLEEAIRVYQTAVRYLDEQFLISPVSFQLGQQGNWAGLFARAVAAHVQAGGAQDAMVTAEGSKSHLLTTLLGRIRLPAPDTLVESQINQERELAEQLNNLDALALAQRGALAQTAAPGDTLAQRQELVRQLQNLWQEMAQQGAEAREYVALRRGDRPTWNDLARLATGSAPDDLPAPPQALACDGDGWAAIGDDGNGRDYRRELANCKPSGQQNGCRQPEPAVAENSFK